MLLARAIAVPTVNDKDAMDAVCPLQGVKTAAPLRTGGLRSGASALHASAAPSGPLLEISRSSVGGEVEGQCNQ